MVTIALAQMEVRIAGVACFPEMMLVIYRAGLQQDLGRGSEGESLHGAEELRRGGKGEVAEAVDDEVFRGGSSTPSFTLILWCTLLFK